jgi:hypothetical protein
MVFSGAPHLKQNNFKEGNPSFEGVAALSP